MTLVLHTATLCLYITLCSCSLYERQFASQLLPPLQAYLRVLAAAVLVRSNSSSSSSKGSLSFKLQ
jgi:hypothetical protein